MIFQLIKREGFLGCRLRTTMDLPNYILGLKNKNWKKIRKYGIMAFETASEALKCRQKLFQMTIEIPSFEDWS